MMTCKLVLQNIRKNIKDYAIYFFTVVIAVSLFYAFNGAMSSDALASLGADTQNMTDAIASTIEMCSYVIAFVLAFLILYVNQFLLKRRKKELGIYMLLGMKKGKISRIFVGENIVIGVVSFLAGILVGCFVEQILLVAVLRAFGGYVNVFQLDFSVEAFRLTLVCFGLIYAVVVVLNVLTVWKVKLIDLLMAERKNEELKMRKSWVYGLVFAIGIICAVAAAICFHTNELVPEKESLTAGVILILAATVLFFYSVSAVVLNLVKKNQKFYYKDVNCFLVRQIGSRIQGNFTSMSMVSFLLTLTLILVTTGTSIAIRVAGMSKQFAPFDFNICYFVVEEEMTAENIYEMTCEAVPEVGNVVEDYFLMTQYRAELTYGDLLEGQDVELWNTDAGLLESRLYVVGITDYNKCLQWQGEEPVELKDNEFLLNCNYEGVDTYMQEFLSNVTSLTVGNRELVPANRNLFTYTYMMTSINNNDRGTLVVPDKIAEQLLVETLIISGDLKEGTTADEASAIFTKFDTGKMEDSMFGWNTKARVNLMYYTMIALPLFIFLYVGLIFMLICVALLSVQQLTAASDNQQRYLTLRRQGVREEMIRGTVWKQVGVYFAAPLALASIYTVCSLPVVMQKLSDFMHIEIGSNLVVTVVLMVLVYGGYYIMTCFSCEKIIAGKK